MKSAAAIFTAFIVVGCTASPTQEPQRGLPLVSGGGDCAAPPPVDFCEWTSAFDAVVVATVVAVHVSAEPCIQTTGQGEVRTAPLASDEVVQALELELAVTHVLAGTAPEKLRVSVGPEALATWEPRPLVDTNGSDYSGRTAARWTASENTLVAGMTLGFAIVQIPDREAWAAVTPFFTVVDERVTFGKTEGCTLPAPNAPGNLDEFAKEAQLCSTSARRLDEGVGFWANLIRENAPLDVRPQIDLAVCAAANTSAGCNTDRDCAAAQTCDRGACR